MERENDFNHEPIDEQKNDVKNSFEKKNDEQTQHDKQEKVAETGGTDFNQTGGIINRETPDNNDDSRISGSASQINGGSVHTTPQTQKTRDKLGVKMLLSGLIGGIVAAVIVVFLFTSNLLPTTNSSGSEEAVPATTNETNAKQIANTIVSDDADIATNINETAKAVVGVLNLQQQNVWKPSQEVGTGSGIVYKKENGKAYIVTNNHVVDGAEEVEIALNDDDRIKAKVLGTDALTDLAVIEIDGKKIDTVAKFGASGDMQIGDTVIAIGNPLGMDFSGSVTKGIISGLERSIEVDTNGDQQPDWVTEVMQTDAAINPGNSGGALVNSDGEVIGINSMKIARQAVEGIGLAIPIDAAIPIIEQLEKNQQVARPYIGISTVALNQVPTQYRNQIELPESIDNGMVIAQAELDSPAGKAGLQQFDVITKIDNQEISSLLDLRKYMYSETKIGDTVKLEIYRDGKPKMVELELVKRDVE